jgi:hypothetical protein
MQVKEITYRNNKIIGFLQQDGSTMVALRPIVEAIGLNWTRQASRVQADPKFNCTHMYTVGADGKQRDMLCIPLKQVRMYLVSINSKKVKKEVSDQLLEYQMTCADILEAHFTNTVSRAEVERLTQLLYQVMEELRKLQAENAELREAMGIRDMIYRSEAGRALASCKQLH